MDNLSALCDSAYYVFDTDKARERVRYLRSKLPKGVKLCYAVKANTFLIPALESEVDSLELCSPGEAAICDSLGVLHEKTVISGVYKTPAFIERLVFDGGDRLYTAESTAQFDLLSRLAAKYGRRLKVLLRLTNDSQFGMDAADLERIVEERALHPQISLEGLQFFSGTQKFSPKKLRRELNRLDAFITKLREKSGFQTRHLEYGTGFPVAYFADEEFDEDAYLADFSDALTSMENSPEITLELGRSVAAISGSYFTHVVDVKRNNRLNYALVDGGMHQLVYFGQHMAMRLPKLAVCGREAEAPVGEWNICGSLCSMNDIIVKQVPLPQLKVGDTLRFDNVGAYSVTEGAALFLSRELPAVYLLENGRARPVRQPTETACFNTPTLERN